MNDAVPESLLAQDPAVDRLPFLPGVFTGQPATDYFSIEAMSFSGSKHILRSPQHFRLERDKPSEPTAAMEFGTACHDGVLEPDAFDARVACAPKVDKRTNVGKAAWAEFVAASAGRIVLTADEFDRCRRCVDAVHAHPAARRLLDGGDREVSLYWEDAKYRAPCKARLDVRNHGGIVDLKTTMNAAPEDFAKSIANFAYHVQGAHYFSGCEHLFDETPQFFAIIAVESEPPHAVATYVLGSASILAGAHRMNDALARYKAALEAGAWPGYSPMIEQIDVPMWARRF